MVQFLCDTLTRLSPLSLFCFVLVSKMLTWMLHDVVNGAHLLPYQPSPDGSKISHIMFADDLIVIVKASIQNAEFYTVLCLPIVWNQDNVLILRNFTFSLAPKLIEMFMVLLLIFCKFNLSLVLLNTWVLLWEVRSWNPPISTFLLIRSTLNLQDESGNFYLKMVDWSSFNQFLPQFLFILYLIVPSSQSFWQNLKDILKFSFGVIKLRIGDCILCLGIRSASLSIWMVLVLWSQIEMHCLFVIIRYRCCFKPYFNLGSSCLS